jgi:hypothetical protein
LLKIKIMKKIKLFVILIFSSNLIYSQELLRPAGINLGKGREWLSLFDSIDRIEMKSDSIWEENNNSSAILQGTFGKGNANLYTDLLSDDFGLVKVTLAGVVNTDRKDSTSDLQTFLSGGGNANLRATLPLLLWIPQKESSRTGCFGIYARSALFFNIPNLGGQLNNPQFGGQMLMESQYSATGEKKLLGINARCSFGVAAGTDGWTSSILKNNNDVFGYGSIGCGLIIKETLVLSFSKPFNLFNAETITKQNASITLSANF